MRNLLRNISARTVLRIACPARTVLRIACPAALAAALITIWLLTVQTPDQTMSLSNTWAVVIAQAAGISAAHASWFARKIAHTVEFFPVGLFLALTVLAWLGDGSNSAPGKRNTPTGKYARNTGACGSARSSEPISPSHYVGGAQSGGANSLSRADSDGPSSMSGRFSVAQGSRRFRLLLAVILICLLCSFGDQFHKLFVPGREFDALDMAFDAAGYLTGIALAHLMAMHVKRAVQQRVRIPRALHRSEGV